MLSCIFFGLLIFLSLLPYKFVPHNAVHVPQPLSGNAPAPPATNCISNAFGKLVLILCKIKIHNNKIYGVNVDDTTHPVLFVPTSDGYVEKYTYSFPRGGSMDNHTIDETLTFKFLKWLDTGGT